MYNNRKMISSFLIVFITSLIGYSVSTFNFLQNIAIQSIEQSFFTIKVQSTHMAALSSIPGTSMLPSLHYKLTDTTNNTIPLHYPNFGNILANPSQLPSLRLSKLNPSCLIIFNSQSISVFTNLSYPYPYTNLVINSTYQPYIIKQSCFGNNETEQYLIIQISNGSYVLLRYVDNISVQELLLPLASGVSKVDQMLSHKQYLCISFQTKTIIYITNMSNLIQINCFSYGYNWTYYSRVPAQNISMDVGGDNLYVAHGSSIIIIQLSGIYYTRTAYRNSSISGISVQQEYPYYYFVITETNTFQIDFNQGDLNVGDMTRFTSTPLNIKCINTNKFIIYQDVENINAVNRHTRIFQVYQYQFNYVYLGGGCRSTYLLNPTTQQCQKILSYPPPLPIPPAPIIVPSIDNQTSNTASNYSQALVGIDEQLKQYFEQQQNKQSYNIMASAIGISLAFSSLRIAPKSLICLLIFFDDLQFYRYHHKNNPKQYPESVKFFMNKINVVNNIRLDPFLSKTIDFFNTSTNGQEQAMIYSQYFQTSESYPNSFYFINNSESIYKNCFIFNLFSFFMCKIIHYMLYLLKNKSSIFQRLLLMVAQYTKWWTLIIAMVQMNIANITFNCSLQFLLPSHFSTFDKFNFIISSGFLYAVILYLTCMYSLIGNEKLDKSGRILLVNFRYKTQSFYLQPLLILSRCFVRSFIQGYFLYDFKSQIVLLTIVDIPFIVLCYRVRAYFKNKWMYLFCFLYLNFLFIFDLFFCIQEHHQSFLSQIAKRELFGVLIICQLGISRLLVSINFIIISLYDMIKFMMSCCHQKFFVNFEPNNIIVSQIRNTNMRTKKDGQQKQDRLQQTMKNVLNNNKIKITQISQEKSQTQQNKRTEKILYKTQRILKNGNKIIPSDTFKKQKPFPLFPKFEQV